jgi:hypothetical protein
MLYMSISKKKLKDIMMVVGVVSTTLSALSTVVSVYLYMKNREKEE